MRSGSKRWIWVIPVGCLGVVVLSCGGLGLALFAGVYQAMSNNSIYKESLDRVRSNEMVIEELGEPIKPGWTISGNLHNSNGVMDASFEYPISGPKGSGNVRVEARSQDGRVTFEELRVRANEKSIDLATSTGIVVEDARIEATQSSITIDGGDGAAPEESVPEN